jgi:hypothetical protein
MKKHRNAKEDCSWEDHHRVPQSYLRQFLWPDGKLKVRDISRNRIFHPKPAQIMCEKGLNNLPAERRGNMPANILETTIFGMWDGWYPSMIRELEDSNGAPEEKLARRLFQMALGLVFRSVNGERILSYVAADENNERNLGTRPGDYPMFAGAAMMHAITKLSAHSALRLHRSTGEIRFNTCDNPASSWLFKVESHQLSYYPDFFSREPLGHDCGGMLLFPCTPDWLLEVYLNDRPFPTDFPRFAVIGAEPAHISCANARIAEATHRFKVLAPPR